jgi:hypothetical protein
MTHPPHETAVELTRDQVDEMLRAYLVAKFGLPVTPFHTVRLTVFPDKFVVRVVDTAPWNPPAGETATSLKRTSN